MEQSNLVLVTGGGGFLGSWVTKTLLEQSYKVRIFSRQTYPHLVALGAQQVCGDLRSPQDVELAVEGVSSVVHSAAKAGVWGKRSEFFAVNDLGTQNLLDHCQRLGVKRFLYTSSPSVCFAGRNLEGVNESQAYADRHLCSYSESKQAAEHRVLSTHGHGQMQCLALRPHLIWGPGDPHFLPRLLTQRRKNRIFRVGNGENLVDVIHVENAAYAHLLALKAMEHDPSFGGKAYFIGQERPVKLWDFIDRLLICLGEKPVPKLSIPTSVAFAAGSLFELFYRFAGIDHREPPMTRFVASQLSRSHYFDHSLALRDFGYQPKLSLEEGLASMLA